MNAALIDFTINNLRNLSVDAADRALCAMADWQLAEIGTHMGLRMPAFGGDKPVIINGALRRS